MAWISVHEQVIGGKLRNLAKEIGCSQNEAFRFPDDAMLDMRILAYYSIPKSGSKKVKAQKLANVIRPTKKPDMDNVVKMVADALNQVAYKDDTQIVDCQVRKFFSEEPRIEVIIREVVPKEVKEEA